MGSCYSSAIALAVDTISRGFRIAVYITMAIIIAWSVGGVFATNFQCFPVAGSWDKSVGARCIDKSAFWVAYAVMNILTDVMVLAPPIPVILKPQLKTREKVLVCLLCGCTPGGIGHALALEFHKKGCHVIASARRQEVLKDLADLGMSTVSLDVTDTASITKCKAEVAALTGGKLDILVNNAGRSHTIPATDIELDDVRATYETNVFGPMLTCQAFIPLLIEARGLIINVSSVSSLVPYLFGAVYSSSKGAINTYSRALRMELKPFNVRVMVAMTGTVKSNIASHVERTLPSDSLYAPVEDVFKKRLTFSQHSSTMPVGDYAARLVNKALKGEGYLAGWVGRSPDWFWAGGLANLVWFGNSFFPRWLLERVVANFFAIGKMTQRLRAAKAKRS